MENVQAVCAALQEKQALFLKYEQATQALCSAEPDSMEHYITKRQDLANQIDAQSENIRALCADSPDTVLLEQALSNRADYTTLSVPLQAVFSAAQEMFGVVARVQTLEQEVLARMQQLRDEARTQMAANQHAPQIARYRSGIGEETEFSLLGNRYDKV